MTRIVLISDTHGQHDRLEVPDGDILIHAGDISHFGELEDVEAFDAWLAELPHRHKIMIAGNHDFAFERRAAEAEALIEHATYLRDAGVTVEGLEIWGSPWTPEFFQWAFMLPRGEELAAKWAQIPESTDVLVTHGPPAGILDRTHTGKEAGCEALRERVAELRPALHVFGHIHEARGTDRREGADGGRGDTLFVNASCPGDGEPVVVDRELGGYRFSVVST